MKTALQNSFLTPIQKELIKITASQINGCPFCLDIHTKDFLKYGNTPQRILLLSAWRDAKEFYIEEEQTIISIAEQIALISQKGFTEETYQKAKELFDESQIADVILTSVPINMWNINVISTHLLIAP